MARKINDLLQVASNTCENFNGLQELDLTPHNKFSDAVPRGMRTSAPNRRVYRALGALGPTNSRLAGHDEGFLTASQLLMTFVLDRAFQSDG